jgi:two-component system nitrate/nitrite response regulator NarL
MPTDTDNLRVLIIAQDPLARAGLGTLLSDQTNCTVVGQVAGDTDFLAELDIYQPDVAVWDLGWDPQTMLDHLAELSETELPIVALLTDEVHVTEAWSAGARGLLPRDVDPHQLATALLPVAQGLAVIEPEWIAVLMPDRPLDPTPPIEELSPRELEVLQLLAEGWPNKTIAHHLEISEHTVKFHVTAIMSKLNAQSRTEAVVRATRLGLILL